MLSAVIVICVAAGCFLWLVLPAMRRDRERPDYPRQQDIMACQQFGESLGWWRHVDMFGYKPLIPPEPDPTYTEKVRVEELQGKPRTHVRTVTRG